MAVLSGWSMQGIAVILLLVTLLYSAARRILTRYDTSLRDIPGPRLAAWTRLWRFFDASQGHAHLTNIELHRKHGKLVRVGPKVISCSDPAMIPTIYNAQGSFAKSAFYPMQSLSWNKRAQPNVFSVIDERKHREMKRKVASAYTVDALLKMEKGIDRCGDVFMQRMRQCAKQSEDFDLGTWLHYYAFDVVGIVTYGERLGFMETDSDVDGVIGAGNAMMIYFACCGQIPFLHSLLLGNPLLPYLIPQIETVNSAVVFAKKALDRRLKSSSAHGIHTDEHGMRDDMLSRWTAMKAQDSEKMNTTDIMVALCTNVFAGADTTATALRAVLYYLMKTPAAMQKAQDEIDQGRRANHLSDPIKDHETRNHLPYINAAIKEALRMHPGTGLLLERHVPVGGAQISGHYLPAGTIVGINSWVVQYDMDVYPEPYQFRPERWLPRSDNAEHLAQMEKSFLAFGAGSRICMGRHLSMIELRKLIPRILQEFEIEMVGSQDWKVRNAWFVVQEMPMCRVRARQ
ncbi:hypothetical protein LTR78_000099 [Recurvomyces mirabilis]|uniref:Pisatin demethylase n=1 Tax=Recurvomyces mirabilis TaxID=574656 RepID=A0AAE0WXB7_9PEZI|nr:hypothetical protein LTR78_000099 [Recurvomyces mirabilis]